jgi:hypothetical protein
MVDDRTDVRVDAAEILLELMGEGRFEAPVFSRTANERMRLGCVMLTRAVPMWEVVITGGGLRQLWPALLDIADAACTVRPKPAGLADLLALLTRYVHEVPSPSLPASVAALAREGGSTKSHHEARALVAAASATDTA